MKIRKIVIFIVLMISINLSLSQEVKLNLKEAIENAYKNDPNIQKLLNSIEIQENNIRAGYGNLFPDLKFNTGWSRTNQIIKGGSINQNGIIIPIPESNQTNDNFSLSLSSNIVLFDGFVNYDRITLAKQNKTQIELQIKKLKHDIAIKIISDYINVLKSNQIVKINEANLEDSKAQLEKIKIFVEVGKRTMLDVYQQDVNVAQNELLVEQAKNNSSKLISELAYSSNLQLNRNYKIDESVFNIEIPYEMMEGYVLQLQNTDNLVNTAYRNRYDLKSSNQNLDILKTNIEISRGNQLFPIITGYSNYSLSGKSIDKITNQRVFTIGLSLSYPIFQGFQLDNQKQLAMINYKSAQEDIKLLKKQIELQIVKAISDIKSLLKQIEITERNLRNAEQNKFLAEESYRIGTGTVLEVNTASTNLNNIKITKSNLIYDFILAQKQLEYYQGILSY
jgi:outer membrane protein